MQRTRIKICGLRDPETARVAVEAGADAIGLVFVKESLRYVEVEAAREIAMATPGFVSVVGVFCDADPAWIREVAQTAGLTTVQLHGSETPADSEGLCPLRIIKALPFSEDSLSSLPRWRGCRNVVGVLFDAPPPDHAKVTGGFGDAFDWQGLAGWRDHDVWQGAGLAPLALAGGLHAENVGEAIRIVRPYAVDVSSGVELSRGTKDLSKIRAFCAAVHRADRGDP